MKIRLFLGGLQRDPDLSQTPKHDKGEGQKREHQRLLIDRDAEPRVPRLGRHFLETNIGLRSRRLTQEVTERCV